MEKYICKERLLQLFLDLIKIDSETFHEKDSANYVISFLEKLNISYFQDEVWKEYEEHITNTKQVVGNIIAYLPGTIPGKPILFSAHLDTVAPGKNKIPILQGDTIVSQGNTILGSDDMAGVTQILEAVRILKEHNIPHRSLELVFPVAEEVYAKGSRKLDYSKIKSEIGYVLDLNGAIGNAVIQAPTILSFKIKIIGLAAHAGFFPEQGIHAITVASKAISKLKLGKIDTLGTRNIGIIKGGEGMNIVPEIVELQGEIRSYKHSNAMTLWEDTQFIFNGVIKEYSANIEYTYDVELKAYKIQENNQSVINFKKVCRTLQLEGNLVSTFGGSDNNNFVYHGIDSIVLSCGMQKVHTLDEYIHLDDLYVGTQMVLELMTIP